MGTHMKPCSSTRPKVTGAPAQSGCCWRCPHSRLGWAGGYFPQPKVAHDHGRADADARDRMLFYDYGAGAVYAKNTFSRAGVTVFRQYVRDLKGLRPDAPRHAMLRRGYVDFVARRAA